MTSRTESGMILTCSVLVMSSPISKLAEVVANVEALKMVQLGMTFMDESPTGNAHVWEINFQDFDREMQPHSRESVEFMIRT